MKPFFSIGVTTYNRPEMLKECLNSIVKQTFTDFEVIVGNDFVGKKLTVDKIGIDDPRIRIINHPKNLGELKNMAVLLEAAKGSYFTWLGDDDLYMRPFFEAVHHSLTKYNFPECVFTSFILSPECPKDVVNYEGKEHCVSGRLFLRRYLTKVWKTQGCFGVFEREYLNKIGGMEQLGNGFSPGSDNLLAIRAGLRNRVVYIDAPLIYFRWHDGSVSAYSPDVEAYSSAHEDMIPKCIDVFKNEAVRDEFEENLFSLLKWCISDLFSVMKRPERVPWRSVIKYLQFIVVYARLLKKKRKETVVFILRKIEMLLRHDIRMWKQRLMAILSNLKRNFLC